MNDERGIQCLGAWSDDGRYALCFLHGFACQRLTGWPNRLRLDVGGGRRPVKRRAKPTRSTGRIDGLLATVSLGAGYRRINRLPATPSIGVTSHEFLLRAGNTSGHGDTGNEANQPPLLTHRRVY